MRNNVIAKWVKREYFNIVLYLVVALAVPLAMLVAVEIKMGGVDLGFSKIKSDTALEKFLMSPGRTARLYPEYIEDTGFNVMMTETQYNSFSVGIGGAFAETNPIKGSSYDYNNRIYFAPVGKDMVLVMIRTRSNSVYKFRSISGLPAVDIDSSGIDGTSNVIGPVAEMYPELLDYEHIYVLEGSYPEGFPKAPIVLASLIAVAVLVYNFLPFTSLGQRITRTGKGLYELARRQNMSYKELCADINEQTQNFLYQNGTQYVTEKYLCLNREDDEKAIQVVPMQEVKSVRLLDSSYPDSLNTIRISAFGKTYSLTVGLKREDAEYIAAFIIDRSGIE